MGKDVIHDRYGRLYQIPLQLARLGHEVLGLCADYHGAEEGEWLHDTSNGELRWRSVRLRGSPVRLFRYPLDTLRELRKYKPDVVIAASDAPHIVMGVWLARQLRVRFVADLYDNFEGFSLTRLPGLVGLYRNAVARADAVTCTSEALAEHVRSNYGARGAVIAVPSTVDLSVFRPRDKLECRARLGLPSDARLVGTAGGLYVDRGISTLYEAFELLDSELNVHLVLAGPFHGAHPPPARERIHYLGELPHERTAELFSALDVGVIYLRNTVFGRYCFPQKAYEMLACGLPIVAAAVGAMPGLLAGTRDSLYPSDDASALARCIAAQIAHSSRPDVVVEDWSQLVTRIEPLLH
ncbi:MAG TPA: glycosyltransferase [Gammaproteobacteria bacterium]